MLKLFSRLPERRPTNRRTVGHGRLLWIEPLEERALLSATHFAVIGNYGQAGTPESDVANLVKSWNPDSILTVGDNNFETGSASTIDANIGQYYHDLIYPYVGTYGEGASTNHFFPTLGSHDWGFTYPNPTGDQPYLNYFTLPGNKRYYTFTQGPVQFFALDSDGNEPDGNTSNSVQGQWLQAQLAASTATYKIVYMYEPPYSSTAGFETPAARWPFQAWGATAVISGHVHNYERLIENNFPYFVDGLGGDNQLTPFSTPEPGSQARYDTDYGAMLINADSTQIQFQFFTRTGTLIDSYSIPVGTHLGIDVQSATVTAGNVANVIVSAVDVSGNPTTSYTGTIHFTSSDMLAGLPANYTFTPGDGGVHTFAVTLATAGSESLTATDTATSSIAGTETITVQPAAASTLRVTGLPSPIQANVAGNVTITALDAFGNTATAYSGTIHFSSSDGQAILPTDYTFIPGDSGVHTFSARLKTIGSQSLTAIDTATNAIAGTQTVTVQTAPPSTRFGVIGDYGLAGTTEGDVANLVKSWNPDLILTVGDNNYQTGSASTIDANIGQYYHDFISPYLGNYGAGGASNRFFPTLGDHDWGFTYPNPSGDQPYLNYFTGLPGNRRYYTFTQGPVQFFALDSNSNEPDGVTSNSVQAQWLQAQLAASTATYKIVYLYEPPYSSSTGFETPQARWPFQAWGATAVISGHTHNYERLIENNFPYFVDGLGGQSVISPFDAPQPGSQVQYNADFGAMLVSADTTQIKFQFFSRTGTLIDTYSIPAGTHLEIDPVTVTAGNVTNVTIRALDSSGNPNRAYTGTVHFTSSDGQAILPADYTFTPGDAGVHTFSATLKTAGSQSLTATDTANSTIAGTETITVQPAAASSLRVAGFPSPIQAGVPGNFSITALDAFGNTVIAYSGTIHFTSSDGQAALPANYTFTPGDAGVHTFSAILKTAGTQSLIGTDTATNAIAGARTITVQKAPTTTRFAIIGDYGLSGQPESDVSNLVKSWNPDLILTAGDNNYETGDASTIDANIGQYYHSFISPYVGSYGAGAATN
ncbi:MAG TPA: metallophosphoesterase, partial [Pirellulales bacterium]|nr:metallophosphoesterase [Pirellulales bacterium]